jgi:hypothetical protein
MSEPAAGGGGPKITPGLLFGFLVGAGVGILIFLICLAAGVDAVGASKRRYPEVWMGIIVLGALGAFIGATREKKGGGSH